MALTLSPSSYLIVKTAAVLQACILFWAVMKGVKPSE